VQPLHVTPVVAVVGQTASVFWEKREIKIRRKAMENNKEKIFFIK
jgi:hypothetical protein